MTMTLDMAARSSATSRQNDRVIGIWLLICCAAIAAMVVIGGITRLTESGLSIVRWEPVAGVLPPLSQADWLHLFDLYKASPQYKTVNFGMSLEEFKGIFWWEYIHRVWGRLIGVIFAVPLAWFLMTGRIAPRLRLPLLGLLCLGGLQGFIGWWMVKSGLRDEPSVSPYRLATHLSLALIIYSLTLWLALGLMGVKRHAAAIGRRHAKVALGLIALTIIAGAFVAGNDAGLIYNEFPLMGDGLIPDDYRVVHLSWLANTFESLAAVQFHHRVLAMLTIAVVLVWRWRLLRAGWRDLTADGMTAAAILQVGLGIWVLLAGVPVWLGAAHQGGAVILLTFAICAVWRIGPRPA
jgi:cytochrome c oxidase assembly protein subunit 15